MTVEQDVVLWNAAIDEIVARDNISRDEANTNFVNLLLSEEVQDMIPDSDVERWNNVIEDLQARYGWSRDEALTNFVNLIHNILSGKV